MNYQLNISGSEFIAGDVWEPIVVVAVFVATCLLIVYFITKKFKENERMKYEFITIIAHKFRTPLTQLKWQLEEMIGLEQNHTLKENISEIQQSTEKLINLTGTLIELTNSDRDTKATYKIDALPMCEETMMVTNLYKNAFHAKNLTFAVQCYEKEVYCRVDKVRFEYVLQTLLENAYNYTPPGRKVEVSVRKVGRKAVISVTDNGIGIAPEDLNKISMKFYRTKNAQSMDTEGFGVGLFLAQSVIHRFGGKIDVASEGLDRGSTFSIILPAIKKP